MNVNIVNINPKLVANFYHQQKLTFATPMTSPRAPLMQTKKQKDYYTKNLSPPTLIKQLL